MGKKLSEITVFISCPGDLNEIRGLAEKAIAETSETLKVVHGCVLTTILWDKDIVPGVGADGQQVINVQTGGQYDIYLGFMGPRFGQPTPRAGSGTEEEFDLALKAYELDPTSLRIVFYLQNYGTNPFDVDVDQLAKAQAFRRKLEEKGVFYRQLASVDDAGKSIKSHLLQLVVNEWDVQEDRWKVAAIKKVAPQLAVEVMKLAVEIPEPQGGTVDSSAREVFPAEMGLLELLVAGNEEIQRAGEPVEQLGLNIQELTQATQGCFSDIPSDPKEVLKRTPLIKGQDFSKPILNKRNRLTWKPRSKQQPSSAPLMR